MDLQQYLADISLKTMSQLHRAIVHLTGGQVLGSAFGMPVVELHTVGRKSGQPRSTILTAPVTEGDRVVLVASKGGDDRDPDWYRNLIAHPDIELTMAGASAGAGPPGVAGREGGVVAPGGGRLSRLRQLPAPHRTRHPAGHLRAALNAHRGWRGHCGAAVRSASTVSCGPAHRRISREAGRSYRSELVPAIRRQPRNSWW